MMRVADLNSIRGIIGIEEYLIHVKELGCMQIVHSISKISYMYFQKELHVMQFNYMNNRALVFTPESLTLKSRFYKCLDPRFFLIPSKLNNQLHVDVLKKGMFSESMQYHGMNKGTIS